MQSANELLPQSLACDGVPVEKMEDVLNEAGYFVGLIRDLRDDMDSVTSGWDLPGEKDLGEWVSHQATVLAYGIRHVEGVLEVGHRLNFAKRRKRRPVAM